MNGFDDLSPADRELVELARAAALRAYAPYSDFKVGAALRSAAGRTYAGCNVENASYGLTTCAERNAIAAAVQAEGPDLQIAAIACVSAARRGFPPCGACRQVIAEFAPPHALVLYQSDVDAIVRTTVAALLPDAFDLRD